MRLATKLVPSVVTLLLAVPGRADVAPPESAACLAKQAGDTCTYTNGGVCVNKTCSKLDYAHWDRDASSSPPSTSYACLLCLTQPSTQTATATNTGTATSTTTPTTTTTETGTGTGTGTAQPTETGTGTGTAQPTETGTGTGTGTGTAQPTETTTATTTATTSPTATTTVTTTATGTATNGDKPPSSDDSSCSVGKQISGKRIAPWLLAGAFSLLFLFGRRRRR